jgi:putative peptide zinc metalloprotease protein
VTTYVDAPARVDGVQLIGEMVGSGYRTPPALVRRADGQVLQLTPLLYAVLEAVDGSRGPAEIADVVSSRTRRSIARSDVEALVDRQLRPRGLVLQADGTAPRLERSNPLTGLRFKFAVTNPASTRRLTNPFTVLFHWWVWLPLLIVFGWVSWWLLMDRGLASATYHAFAKPNLLMVVIAITLLSAGFHEFGHAAAARRGGAQPGSMGAGLYLVWPAFYTDVTDTYRLGRFARLRTDLGGLYFNAIVAVCITAIWWISGWDALLLVVAAQILQMVRQLAPLVRFDGYHVLADLTGVPDLFSRIGPILASFWPTRWHDPRVAGLKWWTRLIVTGWVVVVVPVLLFSLLAMVLAAPRLAGTALASLGREESQAALHLSAGRYPDAGGAILAMAAIAVPLLGMAIIFKRVVSRFLRTLWRATAGRPVRRIGAGVLIVTLGGALAFAWWPSPERYRPVMPYEGGTLLDVAGVTLAAAGYQPPAPPATEGGEFVTVLPRSEPLPTEANPTLALVLVPSGGDSTRDNRGESAQDAGTLPESATSAIEPSWVFPFNEPLPPEPGDNQALAVNTTDGGVTYDVAIAMVWVTDEDPALNVNEAYAFASCSDCVTVAVAFQVVVIVGSADVIVPQNLSGAVNYECFRCITASVASQLVITVDALPSAEQEIALVDLWDEIAAFAESIPTLSLADVIEELEGYKEQILTILEVAVPAATSTPMASADGIASAPATPDTFESAGASSAATEATDSPPSTSAPWTSAPSTSAPSTSPPPSSPTEAPTQMPTPQPTPAPDAGSSSESTTSPQPSSEPPASASPEPTPSPTASASPA